jgi:hypothetical protein
LCILNNLNAFISPPHPKHAKCGRPANTGCKMPRCPAPISHNVQQQHQDVRTGTTLIIKAAKASVILSYFSSSSH